MKFEVVSADRLIQFQQDLRRRKGTLIRAKPFKNSDDNDCYHMMYLEA